MTTISFNGKEQKLFEINVQVHMKHGKPAIELRTMTSELDLIKAIVSAAYHNQPLVILPKFSNKLKSLAQLQEVKLLKYNYEKGIYEWLI